MNSRHSSWLTDCELLHITGWLCFVTLRPTERIIQAVDGNHRIGSSLELSGGLVFAELCKIIHEIMRSQLGTVALQLQQ